MLVPACVSENCLFSEVLILFLLKLTWFPSSAFLVGLCCANDDKQQERSPSVIVIGGGMAGIAAARALQDASFQVLKFFCFPLLNIHTFVLVNLFICINCTFICQVILLESRERPGGRIHTDYSFGFPVDLGASW